MELVLSFCNAFVIEFFFCFFRGANIDDRILQKMWPMLGIILSYGINDWIFCLFLRVYYASVDFKSLLCQCALDLRLY